ncbi:hypothetical protein GCM10011607_11600 [Shewanella inventionis]|uniref:Uncharacterized protein n=1 Tax=Shewanella inventionis TaxID=1738770 RepID=A0ABQ1IV04_9GAMM|nr:hypothetical protein GCM10011607_11600 [Shewanella inventionis]
MLDDRSLKDWLVTLGNTAKAAVDASLREDWPSDEDKDIKELIEDISSALNDITQSNEIEVIKSLDNSTLLGLSALFSFPRTLRLINILGTANPDKLASLTDKSLVVDEESKQFIEMLYVRISYTARTFLMLKIFSSERVKVIFTKLNENIKRQTPQNIETAQPVTTEPVTTEPPPDTAQAQAQAITTNEFDDDGIDFDEIIKPDEEKSDEN